VVRRVGYGFEEEAVTAASDSLFARMLAEEAQWGIQFPTPDETVIQAMKLSVNAHEPLKPI
jgi:hypothetical protein